MGNEYLNFEAIHTIPLFLERYSAHILKTKTYVQTYIAS